MKTTNVSNICPHEATEVSYSDVTKNAIGKICVRCGHFTPEVRKPRLGFFEWLMTKLFRYTDIMRSNTNDIYLRRFFIYPRYKEFKKMEPRIYLHKFYRGDEDPYVHDHPWPFKSFLLTQGYFEETPADQVNPDFSNKRVSKHIFMNGETGEVRVRIFYPRFSFLSRAATWKHRVILKDKTPVWTLIKTGVKERSWGFWVKKKLCPWKTFTEKGVAWCGIEEEIPEA